MPMYDYQCTCGHVEIDVLAPISRRFRPCPACDRGIMMRVWLTKAPGVIPDSIPGGVLIYNGLCHEDGTPQRFDSHTEINKEAARRGLQNRVEHYGTSEGDKSTKTSRWI